MEETQKSEVNSKTDEEKKDSGMEQQCCYVVDPCGCYVDPCGCYVNPCCCC